MWPRILLGFPIVFLLSGFPLARLFLPNEKTFSLRLLLASFASSLFLTYPAAVLTTMLEGQSAQAIYSVHLPTSLFSLFLFSMTTLIILIAKNKYWYRLSLPKLSRYHFLLFLTILIYSFFVFWNLNRADVIGDEYDLGYQAYDLNDGLLASRKAYIISFDAHPPLTMTIKHFSMQLFSPWGLDTLDDWMFRGIEGVIGVGIILVAFLIAREFLSTKIAFIVTILLAVNNYLIFLGRYFNREIYLTFFLMLSLYFFLRKRYLFCYSLLGCAFLIKTPAITLFLVYVLVFLSHRHFKNIIKLVTAIFIIYFPVLIFNLGAYILTGHLDATFSWIFGIRHPNVTPITPQSYYSNPISMFYLLADLYSFPLFGIFLAGAIFTIVKIKHLGRLVKLLLLWLSFVLVFFLFSPMRAYYLLPITIPFVYFTSILARRFPFFPLFLVLVYSAVYSYSSNLTNHLTSPKYGEIGAGGSVQPLRDNFWHLNYSLATAAFTPASGWKEIKQKLEKMNRQDICLVPELIASDLPFRRYLQADDSIKLGLLGKNYHRGFWLCDELPLVKNHILIYYTDQGTVQIKII